MISDKTSSHDLAEELYERGNAFRREQRWAEAMNMYDAALAHDPASPAGPAREMLTEIMNFYCKDYYNP